MKIRPATADDIGAIIELATDMVLHSVSPFRSVSAEEVRHYRRDDLQSLRDIHSLEQSGLFVAEIEGHIVGHIIVVAHQRDSSTGTAQAWIYDLSVRAGYWGQGIGQALMTEAEAFARRCGMRVIGLGVTVANHRAVEFYHHLGYQEERVQMLKNLTP
jgi:GNAT superfamily N-acetyltransferase